MAWMPFSTQSKVKGNRMCRRNGLLGCRFALMTLVVLWGTVGQTSSTMAQDPQLRFGSHVPMAVESIYEKGLAWLVAHQNEDGSWGARGNTAGIDGMCVMAMLAVGEDPNFGKYSDNIRRAVASMIVGQDASTGYIGSSMYHHGFAMLGLSEVYGVLDESQLWVGKNESSQRTIGEALQSRSERRGYVGCGGGVNGIAGGSQCGNFRPR